MALARASESWAWNSNDRVFQMRWLGWTRCEVKTPPVLPRNHVVFGTEQQAIKMLTTSGPYMVLGRSSESSRGQKHFPDLSCPSSICLEKELLCWQAGEHKAPKQMLSSKSGTSPYSQGVCEVLKYQIQSILGNKTNFS